MKLIFYGGVGEVTGANYFLEAGEGKDKTKILVDCGMHQGGSYSEKINWEPFKYKPEEIAAVFITHAHIDHTGNLPKLVKQGFKGKIYSTPPTKDFTELLLMDSEHILMEEAKKHKQNPLYGIEDVDEVIKRWEGIPYHKEVKIGPFTVTLHNAGHILGSSIVEVKNNGKKVIFSGDLGNSPAPIIEERESLGEERPDYCVIESTYGGRLHDEAPMGLIEDVIEETAKKNGVLIIPAFAMERTQKLLFEINELVENGRIPNMPIFLDSPLAIKITDIYKKYPDYFDEETRNLFKNNGKLFDLPNLKKTLTSEESKSINNAKAPKIIIAGAGMMQGGRILHHAKRYLPDPNSTILFIGYQTKNTLGRRILDGEKTVRIHGEEIPVRCRKAWLESYSAHADQKQLLEWLYPMRLSLKRVFVIQGEEEQSGALSQKIINDLAVHAEMPVAGKEYDII